MAGLSPVGDGPAFVVFFSIFLYPVGGGMLYWNQLFTRVFPEEDVEMKHRTVNDYFKQQWPRLILFAAFTLGVSFFAPLKNFQLKWLIDSRSKLEALGYMGLVFAITFASWFFERLSRRSFTKIACGAVEQVRQRILEQVLHRTVAQYNAEGDAAYLSLLTTDLRTLYDDYYMSLFNIVFWGGIMLCALAMDYEGSERWYGELQAFAERCGRQDAAGKQARSRLAWLDISLPQRGVNGLTETIPAVFRLLMNKEVTLPSFSVTSALPSIMNGGKDFSPWSKKDDLLYKTLRLPVEAVLGRDGVGLADCAIAESKFEKGEDVAGRMLSLLPQLNEVRNRGTPDMEFAVSGLLARSQLANGQPADARRTIEVLRECFAERGLTRFLPNMDAMLCRIDMHTGDLDAADAWYREKAPREPTHLNVMRRYQYLTQAMVELADGRPDAALLTLAPLEPYIKNCARIIDGIHLNVLTAIVLRRKKDERWRERLTAALDAATEYRFIRTVSVYGTAVLPLLEALDWDGDKAWRKRLMAAVRTQAAFYTHFLEPSLAHGEELTPTELQILHLLCADKSNAEIAQIMDVKLPTVKTHVSHILDKLDVKRRAEAKTAAKKLHLVQDDL